MFAIPAHLGPPAPAPVMAILVAGQTLPAIARARSGDFPRFIRERTGEAWPGRWVVHDVRGAAPLPGPRDADGFIMTGSSSSVTEGAPWMLRAQELIRRIVAARVPLFGVCFGHQMIAQALGGSVTRNPRGREIGTVRVTRTADDFLSAGLPRVFDVQATHVDAVTRLPPGARVLATTALDPAAAFAVGDRVRGVQFHPEMDADIMRGYLAARAEILRGEGLDPAAMTAGVHDGTRGHDMLRSFARMTAAISAAAAAPCRARAAPAAYSA
ncbi:MAG TPA: glutamine amidotransferase [Polyangiaceae bacterium]|nr:glutamine amidotransferase [Polyangiaceae bacterium]